MTKATLFVCCLSLTFPLCIHQFAEILRGVFGTCALVYLWSFWRGYDMQTYIYVYMCVHTYVPNICIVGSKVNLVFQLGLNPICLNNPYTVWNLYEFVWCITCIQQLFHHCQNIQSILPNIWLQV